MLDQILGGILGGGGNRRAPARVGFLTHLSVTDGDAGFATQAAVVALVPAGNVWTRIWQRTVPAQQAISYGYGTPVLPDNQGWMWFALLDEGTAFQEGVLRLMQQDAHGIRTLVVLEVPDTNLHSVDSTTLATAALISRQDMLALPEKQEFPLVGEDSVLFMEYRTITNQAGLDAAGFRVPITLYQ